MNSIAESLFLYYFCLQPCQLCWLKIHLTPQRSSIHIISCHAVFIGRFIARAARNIAHLMM
jgi:hypothetical protein